MARAGMEQDIAGMEQDLAELTELKRQLGEVQEAVPGAIATAGQNYADAVRALAEDIEDTFQSTVNSGYRNMYLFQVAVNALGLLLLLFYKESKRDREVPQQHNTEAAEL